MTNNTPASEVPWTTGPWTACNMVHGETGEPMTAEQIGEYVKNAVLVNAANTDFLFITTAADGGPDICHVGNGPKGPWNARLIAESPTMAALLEELVSDSECYCCDEGVAAKGPCGWHKATELLSRIRGSKGNGSE